MPIQLLDPKSDFVFKKIFGTAKHSNVLVSFLNDLLYEKHKECMGKIIEVTYVQTIQTPDSVSGKEMVLDIACTDSKGQQYVIEMQLSRFSGFERRALAYLTRVHSRQLKGGMDYDNIQPVFLLAIVNDELFKGHPYYRYDHKLVCDQTGGHHIKDIHLTFFDLSKFKKTKLSELATKEEQWMYFLKYAPGVDLESEDYKTLIKNSPIFREAFLALDETSWTNEERELRERAVINKIDTNAVIKYNRAEGKAERDRVVVANMHKKGLPKETIAEIAEITVEEVEEILATL
jgi:predicted transposase/invertase (TIGR01784 family)